MDFLLSLDAIRWGALIFSAILIGLTKAGLQGGALITVPLLAAFFGSRASSGILLGVLMTADLAALWSYRRDGSVPHLVRTLPWTLAGIVLGVFIGGAVPERGFSLIMALFILASAALMTLNEIRGRGFVLPETWWVSAPLGLLAGIASMIGNAAGPIMGLYLLSSGLGKGKLLGTSVWFFFIVNMAKLPFHLFVWKTASLQTLLADLAVAPITLAATFLGVYLVRLIPEKPYRIFLIVMAAVGGGYLLLG